MKLKLMALLVAMIAVVAMLASCFGGGNNDGGGGGGGGGSDEGNNGKYPWGKTDLLVQLYENSNNDELSPQLKRYCAGQDPVANDEIDALVQQRNKAAYADANVNVRYNYENGFGWGAAIGDIQTLFQSGSGASPDIFANFAYDMTACALRGCFANLLANTSKTATTYGSGANYFAFAQDGYKGTSDTYFDSNAGKGYFFDYMQSLAFANENGEYDKMYCLASNYCIDAVRAFLVVPVNINMLESISVEASTGDVDKDGDFDVQDFYEMVWGYDWTYDALATLAEAVYLDTNTAVTGADIKDTLGLCLGKSSGLTASGVLYTTSVKIINKVEKEGKLTYEYPERNDDLVALAAALEKLFKNTKGVCTLSNDEAKAADLGQVKGDLDGIRHRFAIDKVLFGGIIAVGSLEDQVYKNMNGPGMKGFGVVPVPLYKQDANHTEKYQTLVHNLARIFAISAITTEFEQCSAFLDYQSTNSANILEMYYNKNLVAAVDAGNAASHNVRMLTYIRNHVRDCFDKTYEDVISNYAGVTEGDKTAAMKRWHGIFYSNGYVVTNMEQRYREESGNKQEQLKTVLKEWAKLN